MTQLKVTMQQRESVETMIAVPTMVVEVDLLPTERVAEDRPVPMYGTCEEMAHFAGL